MKVGPRQTPKSAALQTALGCVKARGAPSNKKAEWRWGRHLYQIPLSLHGYFYIAL